ncbi:7315_t:CDS:2 [Racocetra fulgida]|uniref:7315_t:CDS:1 n=1 Tax=Racocetra fulgida TaxID=60492 RepID=A0A9N9H9G6_9GLOM|nr:7315_t:CDS:2 [Racocetra fulgida]
MDSQEESDSSFQIMTYTSKSDSQTSSDNTSTNALTHPTKRSQDLKKLKLEIQQIKQTTLPEILNTNNLYKGIRRKEINKAITEWILLDD